MNVFVATMIAAAPIVAFWLLCAALAETRQLESLVSPTPNPKKASLLSLHETLVYADPWFAGSLPLPWDAVVSLTLLGLVLWSAGLFARLIRHEGEAAAPRLRAIAIVALFTGLLLAAPLVYATVCIVHAP